MKNGSLQAIAVLLLMAITFPATAQVSQVSDAHDPKIERYFIESELDSTGITIIARASADISWFNRECP